VPMPIFVGKKRNNKMISAKVSYYSDLGFAPANDRRRKRRRLYFIA